MKSPRIGAATRAALFCVTMLLPQLAFAGTPLVASKCPNPSATDPQGPQELLITQELPEGQAETFLKTAIYCPSACYDLTAQLTLKKTGMTSGGLQVTVTPHNQCSGGAQDKKRGCASGMTEPKIQIITQDTIGQISVFGMGKTWEMPAQTINKSRCDDTVIYRSFTDFLGGLSQAQNNPQAGVTSMQQALSNLQSQTDPRPTSPVGQEVALTDSNPTPSKPPAFGLPGSSPFSQMPEVLPQGGDTSQEKSSPNPIRETVQPNLAPAASAASDQKQPTTSGTDNGGDLQKIFDVQSNPQTGAPIEQGGGTTGEKPSSSSHIESPAGDQEEVSTQSSASDSGSASHYKALTGPTSVNNSNSSSSGSNSWLSMLGNLLSPLMSLFSGSKSPPPSPPPQAPPPPSAAEAIASLTAEPSAVLRGHVITVSWSSSGTSPFIPCMINQDGRQIGQGAVGSTTITTSSSSPSLIIFDIQCQAASGRHVQNSASVTVQ